MRVTGVEHASLANKVTGLSAELNFGDMHTATKFHINIDIK